MGFTIGEFSDGNLAVTSPNSMEMDSDNFSLSTATLGNELVTNPNMESQQPPIPYIGGWNSYLSASLSAEEYDEVNCCKVSLTSANSGGIYQQLSLVHGKRYKIIAVMRGDDLPDNTKFRINWNGTDICEKDFSNSTWVYVVVRFLVTSNTTSNIVIYAHNSNSMTASFYIDTVSVKEIEGGELDVNGNIGAGGIITGNNLTPNFVPAMFGIHWNAAAEIEYTGGLPSTITWECTGKETVTQTITYNGSDQPTSVVTQGATSGRTATETLTWSGDDLTGYSVAFS